MTQEQFKKGQELSEALARLTQKKDNFLEHALRSSKVEFYVSGGGGYFVFHPNADDTPEVVRVIYRTMTRAIADAYEREIQETQKEFDSI